MIFIEPMIILAAISMIIAVSQLFTNCVNEMMFFIGFSIFCCLLAVIDILYGIFMVIKPKDKNED